MPCLDETAYQQFKDAPTEWERCELYTPRLFERNLAKQHPTGKPALVALLVLLKTFQYPRSRNISFLKPCGSLKEEI